MLTVRDHEELLRAANICHRVAVLKNSATLLAIADYLMLLQYPDEDPRANIKQRGGRLAESILGAETVRLRCFNAECRRLEILPRSSVSVATGGATDQRCPRCNGPMVVAS